MLSVNRKNQLDSSISSLCNFSGCSSCTDRATLRSDRPLYCETSSISLFSFLLDETASTQVRAVSTLSANPMRSIIK